MKGFCMGFGIPGTFNRSQNFASPGRGGGGQGRRNRFLQTGLTGWQRSARFGFGRGPGGFSTSDSDSVPEPQLETLKAQAGHLEETLNGIKQRIQELESGIEGNQ